MRLDHFYDGEVAAGRTNARVWQISRAVDEVGSETQPVLLDERMKHLEFPEGSDARRSLDLLLRLNGTPHRRKEPEELDDAAIGSLIVVTQPTLRAIMTRREVVPVTLLRPPAKSGVGEYWLFVLGGFVAGAPGSAYGPGS
jgi:hypothetical protein